MPRTVFAAAQVAVESGYGQDPPLDRDHAPWPRVLNAAELTQLAILADIIVPGSSEAPAPSRLGIPDFLDEWVSAPYPAQIEDRKVVRTGLARLDAESIRRGGAGWAAVPGNIRTQILTELASLPKSDAAKEQRHFFCRARQLIVSAYYTTAQGMRAIGYVGNVALPSYPGVTGQLEAELSARIQKLGL